MYVFTNPSPRAGYSTRSVFLSGVEQVWIQSFSSRPVAIPKLKSPVCLTILSIAGGKIARLITFPKLFVLCGIQTALSRIWTRVSVSISHDDIQHITRASTIFTHLFRTSRMWHKWNLTGLTSDFSFSQIDFYTKVKKSSLSNYLP